MPNLDGYATGRAIREHPWGQKAVVIALTDQDQEEDRQRTNEAVFDRHLGKPADLEAITNMLTHLLGRDRHNVGVTSRLDLQ